MVAPDGAVNVAFSVKIRVGGRAGGPSDLPCNLVENPAVGPTASPEFLAGGRRRQLAAEIVTASMNAVFSPPAELRPWKVIVCDPADTANDKVVRV